MAKTVSDITTPYGETMPLPEWLDDVEPAYDATATDASAREAFVQARKDANPARFATAAPVPVVAAADQVVLSSEELALFRAFMASQGVTPAEGVEGIVKDSDA